MRTIAAFIFALLLVAPLAFAQPAEVYVSTYVLNVGKFELATGSYVIDFYLDMRCDVNCSPERFEFMNGRASTIDKLIDTPTEKFYRIQATLSQNIDLRNYPFDVHHLSVEIEDKDKTVEDIVYVPDAAGSGVDPSVIIVGWDVEGWNTTVVNHDYDVYNQTFSRYIFNVNISRAVTTSVIKSFLPVFFMVIVSLLSLLIKADKVTTRLTLNTSTLIAAVLFHVNLTSSIPPVGYLTFADKFMLATYFVLIAALTTGVSLMRHTDANDQTKADEIYSRALRYIPVITVVAYAAVFALL